MKRALQNTSILALMASTLLAGCLGKEDESSVLTYACYSSGFEICLQFSATTSSPDTVASGLASDCTAFGTSTSRTMVSGRGTCNDAYSANSQTVRGYCDVPGTPYNNQGATVSVLYGTSFGTNTQATNDCTGGGGTYRAAR